MSVAFNRSSSKRPKQDEWANGKCVPNGAEFRVRHAAKISEIVEALVHAGFRGLNEQAAGLGLPRSTTWTIVTGQHKKTGLSPTTIKLILARPDLPLAVRQKVLEYVHERCSGAYGHGARSRRTFASGLSSSNGQDSPIA